MTGRVQVALRVNGQPHELEVRPRDTLVDALREGLGLYGVREGCGVGMCGACTVLIDGEPQSGCLVLAMAADGKEIETVEGLAEPGSLSALQRAFVDHTAFQCSYCTPGFLLTAKRLLEEHPAPDEATIRDYLAGNLCRCGSYVKIVDAVRDAAGLPLESSAGRP